MARSSRCASSAASVASRPTAPNGRRQLLRTESAGSAPALPTVQEAAVWVWRRTVPLPRILALRRLGRRLERHYRRVRRPRHRVLPLLRHLRRARRAVLSRRREGAAAAASHPALLGTASRLCWRARGRAGPSGLPQLGGGGLPRHRRAPRPVNTVCNRPNSSKGSQPGEGLLSINTREFFWQKVSFA